MDSAEETVQVKNEEDGTFEGDHEQSLPKESRHEPNGALTESSGFFEVQGAEAEARPTAYPLTGPDERELSYYEDCGQNPIEGNEGLLDEWQKNDPDWAKHKQKIEKKRKKEHQEVMTKQLAKQKKTRLGPVEEETSASSDNKNPDRMEVERDAAVDQLRVNCSPCQLICWKRSHPPRSPESNPTERSCTGTNCPREDLSLQELASLRELDKGITPLIIAISQGDLEMVKHMVEVWRVDIRATVDKYILHGFVFEECCHSYIFNGVTPLFVAALNKKSKIVRYLIENGADVSFRTSDDLDGQTLSLPGLTPLHAALFLNLNQHLWESEQLDIIRCLVEYGADPSGLSSNGVPIWKMGWAPYREDKTCHRDCYAETYWFCSPKATRLLIELGMSLVQQTSDLKRTILHHLVSGQHEDVEFLKFLLEKGADIQAKDVNGLTPIMVAAIGSSSNPNQPTFGDCIPNTVLLNHLLERDHISIRDKIDALEVAAAVLLYREQNVHHLAHDPFELLARAKDLRDRANCPLILKITVNGHAAEWITSLYNQPGIQQRSSEFKIQSLLIRLRILSAISWGAVNEHVNASIQIFNYISTRRQDPAVLATCLGLLWTTLESLRRFDPNEKGIDRCTYPVTMKLFKVLYENSNDPLFNADSLKTSFELISATYHHICPFHSCAIGYSFQLYLFLLLSKTALLPEIMSQNDIIDYIRHILSQDGRDSETWQSMIHLPCHHDCDSVLATFRLLLRAGEDPNAVDRKGNGALHYLTKLKLCDDDPEIDSAARLLVHYGANLNLRNNEGMTAADVWFAGTVGYNQADEELGSARDLNDLPNWLREKVHDLSYICARFIHRYQISSNTLPKTLQDYINGFDC